MKWRRRDIANLIRAVELATEFDRAVSSAERLPLPKGQWPTKALEEEEERQAEIKRFQALRRRLLRLEAK